MIGLDTGFFVELVKSNSMAVRIWEGIVEGDESAVSCISLFELQRLSLKGMIPAETISLLFEAISAICKVVWLDHVDLLKEAGHISWSYGIHAIDSLILASLSTLNMKTIYTTDSHIEKYKKKGIKVINMVAGARS